MKKLFLFVAAVIAGTIALRGAEDRIIQVPESDAKMNSAIANARKSLPHFWARFEKPDHGETDFNLKIRIEDKNGVEHFWCSDIRREAKRLSGVINNDPMTVKSVSSGQRVFFMEEQISDWLYMRSSKMIGNYTVRPLMKDMSKEERQSIEAMLGPLP